MPCAITRLAQMKSQLPIATLAQQSKNLNLGHDDGGGSPCDGARKINDGTPAKNIEKTPAPQKSAPQDPKSTEPTPKPQEPEPLAHRTQKPKTTPKS